MTKGWLILLETKDVSDGFMHKDFFAAALSDKEDAMRKVSEQHETTPDQIVSVAKELSGADLAALGVTSGQIMHVPAG